MSQNKIRIGISSGDINGIGLEVIIKTFLDPRMLDFCTPILYCSSKVASYHRKVLGINDFSFNLITDADNANSKRANIINCWDEEVKIELGYSTKIGGIYALKSLECALKDLKENKIDALVTAPIDKYNIQSEAFNFPGHTDYLSQQFSGGKDYLMLMTSETLKIGLVTTHIPLVKISEYITKELILSKLEILNKTLVQDFNIRRPKIAILGLNPHAGDNGVLGNEENEIISPAIKEANDKGYVVFGPYPADGFFGSLNYTKFDGVLAMYHDQGLVPFKTIAFGTGVNYTAGLPIIRTSPDHGTAFEIAGKNLANESSFREAIYLACDIHKNRMQYNILKENSLKGIENE